MYYCVQVLVVLGESHPHIAAGIEKNAMIVRQNFGNLARLIIREKSYNTNQNDVYIYIVASILD
jgi:hypothetical protein